MISRIAQDGQRFTMIEKPLPADVLESAECPECGSHRHGVRMPNGTRRFVCITCKR